MPRAEAPLHGPLEEAVDLIVIGAGINGTAIARDAALRGLRTLLIEQGDLAQGTSSWSSRLIHGGIRYLEHAEVRLVRESLHERERLLHNAPHLVEPYPLLIPFYAHNKRGPLTLRAGMLAYDLLSFDKTTPWHRGLSSSDVVERWGGLQTEGLSGGSLYYDAQCTWAERLCVENALDAAAAGARVRTYTQGVEILRAGPRVTGVRCVDAHTDHCYDVYAAAIVNAAGPWIDTVTESLEEAPRLIGGTKGSHLVVEPFPGAPPTGVHYEAASDGRAVLVLPWAGRYLIGSTDLYVDGDPGAVVASDEEIDYLLAETNRLIPSARLTREDVLFSYSGVRPLPYAPTASSAAEVSRNHIVHEHGPTAQGLVSIVGGKLTTHRALAEQTVDTLLRRLGHPQRPTPTRQLPLPGARTLDWAEFRRRFVATAGLATTTAERLLAVYGVAASTILARARSEPHLGEEIAPGFLAAEIDHAWDSEYARTLTDVLLRRSMIGLGPDLGLQAAPQVAECAVRRGYLSEAQAQRQLADYRALTQRFRPNALAGRQ